MKKICLPIAMLLFCNYVAFAQIPEATYNNALTLLTDGTAQKALANLQIQEKKYPKDAKVYFLRAAYETKMANATKAYTYFEKALAADPTLADAYLTRAYLNNNLKKQDAVIADMTEYIKLKPTDPESYERRGMYYMDFKDYKNALADFEREIALDSSKVNGYAYAAKITAITKDSKAGEIYFEKAAKVSDIDKEVLNILYAVYLSQQKRYDEAKVKFDVAIRDYQKKLMGDEMNEAGITYTNTKDYLFAIDAFYEAIFAAPKNINFRNNLGALYLLMKDYEQLKGNAENTLAVDNKNKTANSYMSAALKGLGKTKEAIPYEQKSK